MGIRNLVKKVGRGLGKAEKAVGKVAVKGAKLAVKGGIKGVKAVGKAAKTKVGKKVVGAAVGLAKKGGQKLLAAGEAALEGELGPVGGKIASKIGQEIGKKAIGIAGKHLAKAGGKAVSGLKKFAGET